MNIRTLDNLKIANANAIIKGFSNSNRNLRKCSSNIQLQGDWYQNLFLVKLTFTCYESDDSENIPSEAY